MEALGSEQPSQRVAASTVEGSNHSVSSTSTDSNTARHEREALVRRTVQVTAALDYENAQLRRLLQQRNQHARRLRDLLTAEHQLCAANASYFFLIKPLTREGCVAIHTEALESVRTFTNNQLYVNLQGCIGGWPIARVVERGMLHHALQKTFYRRSADFVMAQTWALFTEPSRFSTMYSDGLGARVRLVQKLDEDNLVFFREMVAMDPDNEHTVVKSMLLMSKLRVRHGYLILIRGLDQGRLEVEDLVEPLRPPSAKASDHVVEVWNEQLYWAASLGEDLDAILDEVLLGLPDLLMPELLDSRPTEGSSHTVADSEPLLLDFPELLDTAAPPIDEAIVGSAEDVVEGVGMDLIGLSDRELAELLSADMTDPHLQPAYAEEQRRAKARRKSKRQYDKTKGKMAGLRAQVTELEERLQHETLATGTSRPSGQLEQASLLRAQLQVENTQLRQLFQRSNMHLTYLRDVLCAEHKLYVITATQFLVLKPLTPRDCFEFHEGAMATECKFNAHMQHAPITGRMSDWDCVRVLKHNCFNFVIRKTFEQQNAKALGDMTWKMVSDPKGFSTMYSDDFGMGLRLVQVVDSDNLVFFQSLEAIDADGKLTVTKSIMLMSRFRTPTSYRIHVVDLDNDRLALDTMEDSRAPPPPPRDGSEVWDKQFSWIQLDQSRDKPGQCMASYARIIPFVNSNSLVFLKPYRCSCTTRMKRRAEGAAPPANPPRQSSGGGAPSPVAADSALPSGGGLDAVLEELLGELPDLAQPELSDGKTIGSFSSIETPAKLLLDLPGLVQTEEPSNDMAGGLSDEVKQEEKTKTRAAGWKPNALLLTPKKPIDPPAVDTLELRREKARKKSKRQYHQRQGKLAILRAEVAELEARLRYMTLTTDTSTTGNQLEEASLLRSQLQTENTQLRLLFQKSNLHMYHLRYLLCAEHKLYVITASQFLVLKPLTPRDCFEVHQEATDTVNNFNASMQHVKPSGDTCGWGHVRELKRQCFNFALRKIFKHHTAEDLGDKTWTLLSDPSRFGNLYSDGIEISMRLVQIVDADNLVFFQSLGAMDDSGKVTVSKSILLLSRFKTATSYRIHVLDLDNDRLVVENMEDSRIPPSPPEDVPEVWDKQFTWVQFDQLGEKQDQCMVTYAGITPILSSNSLVWMAEIVLNVVRWEEFTFGPRFSLPRE
ncbi:hypothetical protein BBJ28_00013375 [Nothophytophthora sp. Chile5]|nr:hypothetical protein BBJ28_00013375 [Nothophytophthora sp. Chile5]